MPETLATWEKQRHNFAFDEEKEKYVSEKSKEVVESKKFVFPHTLIFFLISNNNWTSSFIQIKYILGDSFNFPFFFGGIFYQIRLTNVFL